MQQGIPTLNPRKNSKKNDETKKGGAEWSRLFLSRMKQSKVPEYYSYISEKRTHAFLPSALASYIAVSAASSSSLAV